MSAYLQLYLDVFNRRLPLTLSNQSAFTGLSNAYQYGKLKFRIYPVRPNGNVTGTLYSVLDLDNLTLKMGIGARAAGRIYLPIPRQEAGPRFMTLDPVGRAIFPVSWI